MILKQAYVSWSAYHGSWELTMQQILWEGFWWPTLKEDVATYVLNCQLYKAIQPMEHITLFHVQWIPTWVDKIYQFICNSNDFTSLPLHWCRQLQEESKCYTIIGKQLYRKGIDGQLRLCVCKNEYILVLHCVHSRIGVGHFSGASTAKQISSSGLQSMAMHKNLWDVVMFANTIESLISWSICHSNQLCAYKLLANGESTL